jgi:hypothetical protein
MDFDSSAAGPIEFDVEHPFPTGDHFALHDSPTRLPISPTSPPLSGSGSQSRTIDQLPLSLSTKPAKTSDAEDPRVSIRDESVPIELDAEPPTRQPRVAASVAVSVDVANPVFRAYSEPDPAAFRSATREEIVVAGNSVDVEESSDTSCTEAESLIDTVMALYACGALQSKPNLVKATADANDAVVYSLDGVVASDNDRTDEVGVFGDGRFIDIGEDLDEWLEKEILRTRTRVQALDECQNMEHSDAKSSETDEGSNVPSSRQTTPPSEDGYERPSEQAGEAEYEEATTLRGAREGMVELLHNHGLALATVPDIPIPVGDVPVQGDRGLDYLKLDGSIARYQSFEIATQPAATSESDEDPSNEESPPPEQVPNADNA